MSKATPAPIDPHKKCEMYLRDDPHYECGPDCPIYVKRKTGRCGAVKVTTSYPRLTMGESPHTMLTQCRRLNEHPEDHGGHVWGHV